MDQNPDDKVDLTHIGHSLSAPRAAKNGSLHALDCLGWRLTVDRPPSRVFVNKLLGEGTESQKRPLRRLCEYIRIGSHHPHRDRHNQHRRPESGKRDILLPQNGKAFNDRSVGWCECKRSSHQRVSPAKETSVSFQTEILTRTSFLGPFFGWATPQQSIPTNAMESSRHLVNNE